MKAIDFNLEKEMKFNFTEGITSFRDSRLVIFDANSIGLLRQNLLTELGFEKARDFFLQFGYQNGYSDCMQMRLNYTFDSEIELLASGPVMHTWEGIVQATPLAMAYDKAKGEFFLHANWTNSYEAEQHLTFNQIEDKPVCWSLTGYASGWATAFFGSKVIAFEPVCMGKGDDHCEVIIKPPSEWDASVQPYINALIKF